MSDDPRVLNSSHSTVWIQWSMVAQRSMVWAFYLFIHFLHTSVLGPFIIYQGTWISLNNTNCVRLCFGMLNRKWVFQQNNDAKQESSEQYLDVIHIKKDSGSEWPAKYFWSKTQKVTGTVECSLFILGWNTGFQVPEMGWIDAMWTQIRSGSSKTMVMQLNISSVI